jgi:hypothetical protein
VVHGTRVSNNGSFMQSWFLAAKIDSFSGVQGSLLNNPEL